MGEFFENEARRFQEEYPWISVEVSHYPDQQAYRESLSLAFESNNAPDVFLRRHTLAELVDNGWVQPIDPWVTPEWINQFPSGTFTETRTLLDGRLYSYPMGPMAFERALYINEDLFRKSGLVDDTGAILVPRTWSDLRTMAQQVSDAGNGEFYGFGFGTKDPRHASWWMDLTMLAGAPGPFADPRTGLFTFGTDPAYAEVLNLLLGMKDDGSMYPYAGSIDDSNAYVLFGQQQFAMFISGSYAASNLAQDFPGFDNYKIVPLPVPDQGRQGGLMVQPQQGTAFMSSTTPHPYEAWLWLNWLSSKPVHERMVAGGNFSVYPDLNTSAVITDPHKLEAYDAITNYIVEMPLPEVRNPDAVQVRPQAVVPDIGDVVIGAYTGQITDWASALEELAISKQSAFDAAIQSAQANGANVNLSDFIFPDWDPLTGLPATDAS